MERPLSPRLLRYLLVLLGGVMVGAGSSTILFGASAVPGATMVVPSVDSEMRFYAVWYVVVGVMLLRRVADLAAAGTIVWLVGLGFFAAGCARVISWVVVGKPHMLAIVLMVIELVLPFVIIPWRSAVAGASDRV